MAGFKCFDDSACVFAAGCDRFRGQFHRLAVYFSILVSTVVFSWSLEKMVFAAALVLAFSDCFMFIKDYFQGTMLMKILALLVYYGSLLLYGAALWQRYFRSRTEIAR